MNPFILDNLRFSLKGKRILLGISGSIAAFKVCDVVRFLRLVGAEVRVIMTEGAQNFVTPTTLETLSGNPVVTHLWNKKGKLSLTGTHHIDTARWANLILIAPATAHVIAKLAHGFADDMLTTEILAFQGPVAIVPAMNPAMFSNPAVQHNLDILRSRLVSVIGPASGITSCGEEGLGRMIEPDEILERTAELLQVENIGKKMLISVGPTRSYLDPVRYLTNRSSGLMGCSLAWAASQKGYKVSVVTGPTEVPFPKSVAIYSIYTAKEMSDQIELLWPQHDIFIGAAAVLDWDVRNFSTQKMKKTGPPPMIELIENVNILHKVATTKREAQFVFGFAAETENPLENAAVKLGRYQCDAIFVNDVSNHKRGFETETNAGWWISNTMTIELLPSPKISLARDLLLLLEGHLPDAGRYRPIPQRLGVHIPDHGSRHSSIS